MNFTGFEMAKLSKEEKKFQSVSKKVLKGLGRPLSDERAIRFAQELEYFGKYDALGDVVALKELVDFARSSGVIADFKGGGVCESYICRLFGVTELDPVEHGFFIESWLNGLGSKPMPFVTIFTSKDGLGKLTEKAKGLSFAEDGDIAVKEDRFCTFLDRANSLAGRKIDFSDFNDAEVFVNLTDAEFRERLGLTDCGEAIARHRPGNMDALADVVATSRKALLDGVGEEDAPTYDDLYGLADCLASSDGRLLYREQAMDILAETAGFSYGHADKTLTSIKEGRSDEIKRDKESFIFCCHDAGMGSSYSEKIWNVLMRETNLMSRTRVTYEALEIYKKAFLASRFGKVYDEALSRE